MSLIRDVTNNLKGFHIGENFNKLHFNINNGHIVYNTPPAGYIAVNEASLGELQDFNLVLLSQIEIGFSHQRSVISFIGNLFLTMLNTSLNSSEMNQADKKSVDTATRTLREDAIDSYHFAMGLETPELNRYKDINNWSLCPLSGVELFKSISDRSDYLSSTSIRKMMHSTRLIKETSNVLSQMLWAIELIAQASSYSKVKDCSSWTAGQFKENAINNVPALGIMPISLEEQAAQHRVVDDSNYGAGSYQLLEAYYLVSPQTFDLSENYLYQSDLDYIFTLAWNILVMTGLVVEVGQYCLIYNATDPNDIIYSALGYGRESNIFDYPASNKVNQHTSDAKHSKTPIIRDFLKYIDDSEKFVESCRTKMGELVVFAAKRHMQEMMDKNSQPQIIEYQNDFAW